MFSVEKGRKKKKAVFWWRWSLDRLFNNKVVERSFYLIPISLLTYLVNVMKNFIFVAWLVSTRMELFSTLMVLERRRLDAEYLIVLNFVTQKRKFRFQYNTLLTLLISIKLGRLGIFTFPLSYYKLGYTFFLLCSHHQKKFRIFKTSYNF